MKNLNSFFLRITVSAFALAAIAVNTYASYDDNAPAWMQQAAKATPPSYDKDVPAVVLYNEESVNVAADGTLTTTKRYAVRLLTRDGKNWAEGGVGYLQSSSKVRDFKGWLIRPGGTTKSYGKDAIMDRVSDPDDIYDEYRVKTIDASSDADIGAVFGFESVTEERPLFTQDTFGFQRRLPSLVSRYSLNLPAGWKASSITFNRATVDPVVSGTSYVWEVRDLAPIPPEPDGLSVANLAPRIAINYSGPNGGASSYESWKDVSQWYTTLSEPSLTLDDAVAGKARDLAANAKTDLERIRAIAEYVQSIRYISLDIGVARGGGHRPRPANVVLQRGYGDCKDKANLMRTMLKALKIDSYLVLIYSGDPQYVRAEWASPGQFNHCIIAIKVSDDIKTATVLSNDKLGRIMIFDPTDPYTQLGDLPDHEQGSYALVSASADGDLLKMPVVPAEENKLERKAEITLTPEGAISGKIFQTSSGNEASLERGRLHELSAADYKTSFEQWLSSRVKGGTLVKASPTDRKSENKFDLDLEFTAPTYAQLMQGRLMMFKPAMVGRLDQFTPVEGKRVTPILIDASAYSEHIKVKLPDGFVVDEMPDADKIETAFGKYSSKFEVSGGYLTFTRSLFLNRTIVPPSGYEDVKRFFGIVRNAEQTPVVLIKK